MTGLGFQFLRLLLQLAELLWVNEHLKLTKPIPQLPFRNRLDLFLLIKRPHIALVPNDLLLYGQIRPILGHLDGIDITLSLLEDLNLLFLECKLVHFYFIE